MNIHTHKSGRIVRLAITPGEPAGIGPDVLVQLAQSPRNCEWVAVADPELLRDRARDLGLPLRIRNFDAHAAPSADPGGTLCVEPVGLSAVVQTGVLNPANADYVLSTLTRAVDGCVAAEFDAMITGPVHKGIINDAGFAFTGHTEFIAERTRSFPVMMLVSGDFRVALATTHIPVSAVARSITRERLSQVISVLQTDLQTRFGLQHPRILVCGLNPHAGENGHLGREEIDVINPVLERMRADGVRVVGPLPADTLFTPRHLDTADAVLAMFHDQGLPVLKYAGFGTAVNLTLGLPIVRTSVDHGTATDLAGTGEADAGSLQAALALAAELARNHAG